MSLKRRMKRIERQFNTANIGQRVNDLILDLYFPPVDNENTDYMTKEWVMEWLRKRSDIARVEKHLNTRLFENAALMINDWSNGGFLKNVAPDYPEWPQQLEGYQDETDCIISAHLMESFNINSVKQ